MRFICVPMLSEPADLARLCSLVIRLRALVSIVSRPTKQTSWRQLGHESAPQRRDVVRGMVETQAYGRGFTAGRRSMGSAGYADAGIDNLTP